MVWSLIQLSFIKRPEYVRNYTENMRQPVTIHLNHSYIT